MPTWRQIATAPLSTTASRTAKLAAAHRRFIAVNKMPIIAGHHNERHVM
jgi:hypothetical protein